MYLHDFIENCPWMSLHHYHEILKGTKWNPLHPWKCCGSKTYMSIWKKWPQISVDLLRKAQHGKNITCLTAQYSWATWFYHSLACWATEGSWGNKKLQIEALFYNSRSNLLILVSTFNWSVECTVKNLKNFGGINENDCQANTCTSYVQLYSLKENKLKQNGLVFICF